MVVWNPLLTWWGLWGRFGSPSPRVFKQQYLTSLKDFWMEIHIYCKCYERGANMPQRDRRTSWLVVPQKWNAPITVQFQGNSTNKTVRCCLKTRGGVGGRWRWDDGNSKNLGRRGTTESELVWGFHSWVFASKKKYIKDECFFYPSGVTVVKMTVQGAVLGPRRGLRVTYWVGVHVHVLLQERPSGWRWSALQRGCEERRRKLLKEKFDIQLMGKY